MLDPHLGLSIRVRGTDDKNGRCECVVFDDGKAPAYCIPEKEFPPKHCADYPAHTCYAHVNCDQNKQLCGSLKPFTDLGCQRSACSEDSDRPGDQVCYRAADWGDCEAPRVTCQNKWDTQCECAQTKDCAGSYCLEPSAVNPICTNKSNEPDCLGANQPKSKYQCAWVDALSVNVKEPSCEPTLPQKRCVAMQDTRNDCQENAKCKRNPRAYFRKDRPFVGDIISNTAKCGLEPLAGAQCLDGVKSRACDCECKP